MKRRARYAALLAARRLFYCLRAAPLHAADAAPLPPYAITPCCYAIAFDMLMLLPARWRCRHAYFAADAIDILLRHFAMARAERADIYAAI